jgi:DNA-binding winged helix-turn-helix (wHTH) protein
VLLESAGEVVTREELRERLWAEDTFVDFDHRLAVAVSKLRDARRDSAEKPRLIETFGRRGYRLVGQLERTDVSSADSSRGTSDPSLALIQLSKRSSQSRRISIRGDLESYFSPSDSSFSSQGSP